MVRKLLLLSWLFVCVPLRARDLWIDPVHGSDANDGASRATALRTLGEAWRRVPMGVTLAEPYRLLLTAGVHPRENVPVYMESRWGTAAAPIAIMAADAPRSARVEGDFNIYDTRYLSLIGLDMTPRPAGDVVHLELCDHVTIRDCNLDGGGGAQESLKANQSQYLDVTGCDIQGAWDNDLDYVAVQYARIANNRIHGAGDWCAYTKGGSAYIRVEGNEIWDCGTGGFTAGQGSGFQYMVPPWIHYEAYDVKVIHNVIHDTEGAGLGVNGGYNILFAYNTLTRVGSRSHLLEFVYGLRSCDEPPGSPSRARCQQYLDLGGWGTTVISDGTNDRRIPNRNVFVYDNTIVNPPGFLAPQHITVAAPYDSLRADDNLRIVGNTIVNGDASTPIGLEDDAMLRANNAINGVGPSAPVPIPDFTWNDAPAGVPQGTLANQPGVARRRPTSSS
jgi:hypothetical protein